MKTYRYWQSSTNGAVDIDADRVTFTDGFVAFWKEEVPDREPGFGVLGSKWSLIRAINHRRVTEVEEVTNGTA